MFFQIAGYTVDYGHVIAFAVGILFSAALGHYAKRRGH